MEITELRNRIARLSDSICAVEELYKEAQSAEWNQWIMVTTSTADALRRDPGYRMSRPEAMLRTGGALKEPAMLQRQCEDRLHRMEHPERYR